MMVSRAYLPLLVALPLLAVSGCSSQLQQPVLTTYAKSVEQLGITPVYPPREDIQVGDVYAVEESDALQHSDTARAKTAFLDTIDMTADIQTYLQGRYKFAETNLTDKTVVAPATKVLPQQPQTDKIGSQVMTKSDMSTLPITGFPQIEVDSGITVGVGGQPKGLAAVFGFEAAKTLKMSLQFGGVTSYAVPIVDGMSRITQYCGQKPTYCISKNLAYVINQKYQLGQGAGSVTAGSLMLVTKVYLARQITYTFNDTTLAGAALASQGSAGAAPAVSTDAINAAAAKGEADVLTALADIQKSLNDATSKVTTEGGEIKFAGVNANSVTFNEVFQRPVVVGYEGVSMQGTSGGGSK